MFNRNRSWITTRNSFCKYIDKNDASLIEKEAGLMKGALSTYILMKIMRV